MRRERHGQARRLRDGIDRVGLRVRARGRYGSRHGSREPVPANDDSEGLAVAAPGVNCCILRVNHLLTAAVLLARGAASAVFDDPVHYGEIAPGPGANDQILNPSMQSP